MKYRKNNNLIVIENGQISTYLLDDKLQWTVGRISKENHPDIKLHSLTVSRSHGIFRNVDGVWFYVDGNGKNGTVYNKSRIRLGKNGKINPIMIKDGDIFVFGGGEEEIINSKTIWAMFTEKEIDTLWRVVDTKGLDEVVFHSGRREMAYHKPDKGTVINMENGIAIYMGDITYLSGEIEIVRN